MFKPVDKPVWSCFSSCCSSCYSGSISKRIFDQSLTNFVQLFSHCMLCLLNWAHLYSLTPCSQVYPDGFSVPPPGSPSSARNKPTFLISCLSESLSSLAFHANQEACVNFFACVRHFPCCTYWWFLSFLELWTKCTNLRALLPFCKPRK